MPRKKEEEQTSQDTEKGTWLEEYWTPERRELQRRRAIAQGLHSQGAEARSKLQEVYESIDTDLVGAVMGDALESEKEWIRLQALKEWRMLGVNVEELKMKQRHEEREEVEHNVLVQRVFDKFEKLRNAGVIEGEVVEDTNAVAAENGTDDRRRALGAGTRDGDPGDGIESVRPSD